MEGMRPSSAILQLRHLTSNRPAFVDRVKPEGERLIAIDKEHNAAIKKWFDSLSSKNLEELRRTMKQTWNPRLLEQIQVPFPIYPNQQPMSFAKETECTTRRTAPRSVGKDRTYYYTPLEDRAPADIGRYVAD